MEVFRIAKEVYAKALVGSGKMGRWNVNGQEVIYTGSSRSLSTLELVVQAGIVEPADSYRVMVISIADDDRLITQIQTRDLPGNWRSLAAYSKLQKIGAEWFNRQKTLVLKVPSAVIPQEYNYIINTKHPQFAAAVQLVRTEDYFWDTRLL